MGAPPAGDFHSRWKYSYFAMALDSQRARSYGEVSKSE